MLISLALWADAEHNLAVLGDSMVALQNAMTLKGSTALAALARELAWRKARFGWIFTCGHLPAEANVVADALSRLTGPEAKFFPEELRMVARRKAPALHALWQVPTLPKP